MLKVTGMFRTLIELETLRQRVQQQNPSNGRKIWLMVNMNMGATLPVRWPSGSTVGSEARF